MSFRSGIFLFNLLLVSPMIEARTLNASDLPWTKKLHQSGIKKIYICGSPSIQPNKRSINKDFLIGPHQNGYFFTQIPNEAEYFKILKTHPLSCAKTEIQTQFGKAHLWRYSTKDGPKDLGTPSQIDLPFTATIQDCVESSLNSNGIDCSKYKEKERESCCREKFNGPIVHWGDYKLPYSPDPSVRLKLPDEKTIRYCNVQESVELK